MRTAYVFAVGMLGLVLSQGQIQAQIPKKGSADWDAKVTVGNPRNTGILMPLPSVEWFTADLRGDAKHGNFIYLHGLIKNVGDAATPATVIYKVEIKSGGLFQNFSPWVPLGTWHGDVLKPNQTHHLRNVVKAPFMSGTIRLTVLSSHKIPNSQDFFQYAQKSYNLLPLNPDLGISSLTTSRKVIVPFTAPTFVATIKNFGNQLAQVDYKGGRSWKLYLATGAHFVNGKLTLSKESSWQFITGAPIGSLKLGQERTIDLLKALYDQFPTQNVFAVDSTHLPRLFNQSGTVWKIEITGKDANAVNNSREMWFK